MCCSCEARLTGTEPPKSHMARLVVLFTLLMFAAGCGTTRWTDTSRTATEQLLLSSAIDTAINNIDFSPLAGKDVYFDATYLNGITDEKYVVSSLRQHMLAYGCSLKETRAEAEYVIEARAGVVGTNRHDLMLGIPSFNLPTTIPGVPSAIPEVPFAKSTSQKGVAKIAVFARHRESGVAVWQSGAFPVIASAQDSWFFGAGPFQRGTIYDGTRFAGSRLLFSQENANQEMIKPKIPVTAEAIFEERPALVRQPGNGLSAAAPADAGVVQANGVSESPAADSGASEAVAATDPAPAAAEGAVAPPAELAPPEEVLSGRIVRLPPVDQRERPDLYAELEQSPPQAVADDVGERQPPPSSSAASQQPDEPPPQVAFSIFRPSTWFRRSNESVR